MLNKIFTPFFSIIVFFNVLHAQISINPKNIEIVRDSFGVPHIFAPTDAEVAYGLAWATLEDDPKTTQFLLNAAKMLSGRSMGVDGAAIDYAAHLLNLHEIVDDRYEKDLSPEFRKVLESYAAGANAYAKKHPKDIHLKKAVPITGKEIVVGYMLGQSLMVGIDDVLKRINNNTILDRNVPEDTLNTGSNAFAFNSSKTVSGETFLAINSHQPLEGILSWYEAHLCSEEGWNIVGGLFHGAVSIFHGTNENLGWAHTSNGFDKIDVFQLEMHPTKKLLYKVDEQWLKLEKKRVLLKVGLGKKHRLRFWVPKKIYKSVYGPTMKNKLGYFSIRFGAGLKIEAPEQWWRMNKARNYTEFKKALELQGLASQGITYADKNDTIFFFNNGIMPRRADGYDWKHVVPGNSKKTLWTEYTPVNEIPQIVNPKCGWIFNTNNSELHCTDPSEFLKIEDYDPNLGLDEDENNRSLRVFELMEQFSGKISWDDFLYIKHNRQFPDSMIFRKNWFDINLAFEIDQTEHPDIADALKKIKGWNKRADTHNRDAPIVFYSMYELFSRTGKKAKMKYNTPEKQKALMVVCIQAAQKHMIKHFGTIDKQLGEVQRLTRGTVDLPLAGGPTAIKAVYTEPMNDGRRRIWVGESYIQLVRFTTNGPIIESVAPYGASNRLESPHATDQMELYANEKRKLMSLDKEAVYRKALRVYHPE